jgi:hypothetical protein
VPALSGPSKTGSGMPIASHNDAVKLPPKMDGHRTAANPPLASVPNFALARGTQVLGSIEADRVRSAPPRHCHKPRGGVPELRVAGCRGRSQDLRPLLTDGPLRRRER